MNTPKIRWLKHVDKQCRALYLAHGISEHASAPVTWADVLQQQVADDKGVLTWVDVPIIYETGEKE